MRRAETRLRRGRGERGAITLSMTFWILLLASLLVLRAAEGVRSAMDRIGFDRREAGMAALAEAGLADGLSRLGHRRDVRLPDAYESELEGEGRFRVSFSRVDGRRAGTVVRIGCRAWDATAGIERWMSRRAIFVPMLFRPPVAAVGLSGRLRSSARTRIVNDFGGRASTGFDDAQDLPRLFGRSLGEQRALSGGVVCGRRCRIERHGTMPDIGLWVSAGAGRLVEAGRLVVGSRSSPVVAVIDGSLAVSERLDVHGLLVVRGDLHGRGGDVAVRGAMLVAGDVELDRARIDYDPVLLGAAMTVGLHLWEADSWRMPAGRR